MYMLYNIILSTLSILKSCIYKSSQLEWNIHFYFGKTRNEKKSLDHIRLTENSDAGFGQFLRRTNTDPEGRGEGKGSGSDPDKQDCSYHKSFGRKHYKNPPEKKCQTIHT